MKKIFSFFAALLFAGSMMAAEINCSAVYSLAKNDAAELNPVTVTYLNGANVYVKDASASLLLYLPKNTTVEWKAGDVLTGVAGTVDIYNGLYEVKPSADQVAAVTVAAGEAPAPEELTAAPVDADMNKYVIFKGVSVEGEFTTASKTNLTATIGEETFTLRNNFQLAQTFVAGKTYNIIGAVAKYNANMQVYFISAEEETPVIGGPEYYLVGSKIGWEAQADYKLAKNPEVEGEWTIDYTAAAEEGLKVLGVEGEVQTWYKDGMGNEYVVSEAGDYTVKFRPAGNPDWSYTYFTLVKKEEPAEVSCADVYSLEKGANVDLNPVTVTYVNGANVYVKDEKGALLIYLQKNTASWVAGDVLTGLEATLDIYNGLYELKPTAEQIAAVSISVGEAPAPEELAAIPAAADVNKYVILRGVSVEAGEFTTDKASNLNAYLGDGTFVLRNNFKLEQKFEEGKTYDIEGAVAIYTDKSGKTTVQLYFISAKEIIDPSGYFIVGNFSDWKIDADYKLAKNPAVEGEYMAQMFLSPEYAIKIVYTEDGENIKTWYPEGMGNAYGENGEITASAGYTIYFRPAGGVEGWFHGFFYVEQVEEVDVTISNGLIYNDAVASEGWWDIYGENDKYAIELSNIETTEAPGYYDMVNDLDPDYCWIVDLTNPNDTIGFVSGGVTLAISAEGVVTVIGQLAGDDGKIYNINLTYTDPKPEKTVVVNITNGEIYDEYAAAGLYLFYGEDPAEIYVQLEIWPDEFPGNFTTADLTSYIAGSLVEDNGNILSIFSVEGSVVAGATEGVYTLTADILCYNNTLYKVTMKIGEDPQGINNVDAAAKAVKALRNGILVIEKNNVQYNVNGAVIR